MSDGTSVREASVVRPGSKGQRKASINPAGSQPVCLRLTGNARQKPLRLLGPPVAPVVLFVDHPECDLASAIAATSYLAALRCRRPTAAGTAEFRAFAI